MTGTLPGTLVLLAALVLLMQPRVLAQGAAGEKGKLEQLGEHVGKILKFSLDGGRLVLDREHWKKCVPKEEADKVEKDGTTMIHIEGRAVGAGLLLDLLVRAAGGFTSSNGTSWGRQHCTHSGGGLWTDITSWDDGHLELTMREDAGPKNDLRVADDRKGSLRIFFRNAAGDSLILAQESSGLLAVVQTMNGTTVALHADSFLALAEKNAKYVKEQLFPSLARFGVGLPELPGGAAPATARPVRPTQPEKGKLSGVAADVGRLVKVSLKGRSLALDHDHWYSTEATGNVPAAGAGEGVAGIGVSNALKRSGGAGLFERLAEAAGCQSSSYWPYEPRNALYRWSNDLALELEAFGGRVDVTLRERTGPRNEIRVSDDGCGAFHLLLTNKYGDVLVLAQQSEGRVVLVQATGDEVRELRADSFLDLDCRNEDYVTSRLFPALRAVGVRPPPARFDAKVVEAVCSRLRPLTQAERAEFLALLKLLDDDAQTRREAATVDLAKKYPRFAELVGQAVRKPPSMEAETRLGRVITANAEAREIIEFIGSMKLLDDRAYLIRLLDKVAVPDRAPVVGRLEGLTGQKLGDDPAAWKRVFPDPDRK